METFLISILDWSEAWAPLITLFILWKQKKQSIFFRPVVIYLCLAFFLLLFADIYVYIKDTPFFIKHLKPWIRGNNVLYNLHAVVLFVCFSYFFLSFKKDVYFILRATLPVIFLVLVIVNFSIIREENFFKQGMLSGNLLTVGAYLLLIYCLQFYLSELRNDVEVISSGPAFWIVTGLSVYVVVNFFVFLFYVPLTKQEDQISAKMWNVHNVAYIIFCIFISKAFYEPVRHQHTI